jgi:hypothetical protein
MTAFFNQALGKLWEALEALAALGTLLFTLQNT